MTLPAPTQTAAPAYPAVGAVPQFQPIPAAFDTSVVQSTNDVNLLSAAVDKLEDKLSGLSKRMGQRMVHFAAADFAGLSGAAADAATFEHQLGTLNATAAVTPLNMRQVKKSIEDTFTSLPVSRGDVAALATSLTSMGVTGARDVGKLVNTFLKLSAATGEGPQELASGLVQLSRLFGNTDADKIGQYANSLLMVSKNAGVSATGVLSFATAIAPLARSAGIGQASVLGISAAFSKAGADGFVAANTFNSIVSDITNLTQSGSPELAKYANLIGVTVGQFKSMDKTTAFERIFDTISKQGPAAINTLNRLGIDGVRAQSAITAVVQSGDLDKQIATAQANAGGTEGLEKAAKAGEGGVVNAGERLRNQFTDIGSTLGEDFLPPMTLAIDGLTKFMHTVGIVITPFKGLIDLVATAAGAFSALGGGTLLAGGLLAKLALGGFVLRSSPIAAFRGGRANAATGAENAASRAAAAGTMRGWQTPFYRMGQASGARVAGAEPGVRGPGFISRAAALPVRGANWLVSGQREYVDNARTPGFQRTPGMLGMVATGYHRLTGTSAPGEQPVPRRPSPFRPMPGGEASEARTAAASARVAAANDLQAKSSVRVAETEQAVVKAQVGLGAASRELAANFARLGASSLRTGIVNAGAGGAFVARRAVSGARSLYSGLGGALGLGLIGATVLPSLLSNIASRGSTANYSTTEGLNPLQKLNDQLNITTTNLASFASSVSTADKSLDSKIPANVSLQQAATAGRQDVADFAGGKNSDKNLAAVAKAAPGDIKAATAYGRSLNMTDNRTVAAFKANLLAQGYSTADTNKILSGVTAGGTSILGPQKGDLSYLTSKVAGTEGNGLFPVNASDTGKSLIGTVLSSVGQQYNTDLTSHSTGYAATNQYKNALDVFSKLGKDVAKDPTDKSKQKALANAIQTLTGGSTADAQKLASKIEREASSGTQDKYLGTAEGLGKFLEVQKVGSVDTYLKNVRAQGGVTDTSKIADYLKKNADTEPVKTAYQTNVGKSGALGQFALMNDGVQGAIANPNDPAKQYSATMGLYDSATNMSKSVDGTVEQFDKLMGAIKDTSDPLYILAKNAKAYAQQQEQYALPTMSRVGQLTQVSKDYTEARRAQALNPTADTASAVASTQGAFESQKQGYIAYLNQTYQAAQQYGTSMERANEDQNKQIARANEDFYRQQEYSREDFNRQTERSLRDHSIQLKNQVATNAQTIYNPYQRVQPVMTNGAGTIEANLGDENQRLRRQKQELDALKGMGLSMQAIQTLNLASPDQAQQLDRLLMDAKADPSVIANLNAQTATRVKLTGALTQNNYNLSFQQGNQDFTRGLSDAAKDYEIAQHRAEDAQQLSLNRMAQDFSLMMTRSRQDLATQMKELYGDFGTAYARALGEVNSQIGKYAPQIAKTLTTQLAGAKAALGDVAHQTQGIAQIGVIGIASNGKVGSYDATGKFTPYQGYINPVQAENLTRVYSPTTGHAMGGLSTRAHVANFSEGNKPEIIVPLQQATGVSFMTSFVQQVSTALLRQMQTSNPAHLSAGGGGSPQVVRIDKSTNYTGPVTVQAQDPDDMGRKLEAKRRLSRLTAPSRSAAST